MAVITYDEVFTRVVAAVNERGRLYVNSAPIVAGHPDFDPDLAGKDQGWETCRYFMPDGSPSCIVGVALAGELAESGVTPGSKSNERGIFQLLAKDVEIPLTARAIRFLWRLQSMQDHGKPWGEALDTAAADVASSLDSLDDTVPADDPYNALRPPIERN